MKNMNRSKISELVEKIRKQSEQLMHVDEKYMSTEIELLKEKVRTLYGELSLITDSKVDVAETEEIKMPVEKLSVEEKIVIHAEEEHIKETAQKKQAQTILTNDLPSLNEKFKTSGKPLVEKAGRGKIEDLKRAFGVNDKIMFIRELFKGDTDAFNAAVRKLNEMQSFHEADQFLKIELAKSFHWNFEDELVMKFAVMVERRFL